jgi:hypothetical protein
MLEGLKLVFGICFNFSGELIGSSAISEEAWSL